VHRQEAWNYSKVYFSPRIPRRGSIGREGRGKDWLGGEKCSGALGPCTSEGGCGVFTSGVGNRLTTGGYIGGGKRGGRDGNRRREYHRQEEGQIFSRTKEGMGPVLSLEKNFVRKKEGQTEDRRGVDETGLAVKTSEGEGGKAPVDKDATHPRVGTPMPGGIGGLGKRGKKGPRGRGKSRWKEVGACSDAKARELAGRPWGI